ncbi:hypothetical protein GCK32_013946, partial [Trichostrongylus colubriformis]
VSAWLTKTNGDIRGWKSSPALMQQRRTTSSTISEIPRVVVTVAGDAREERSRTPCLSLMYDFAEEEQQSRSPSRCSISLDLDQGPPVELPTHSLSLDSC